MNVGRRVLRVKEIEEIVEEVIRIISSRTPLARRRQLDHILNL